MSPEWSERAGRQLLMTRYARTLATAAMFLGTILAANYTTTRYGLVPVGFGLTATAGTYFAGLAFVLRDSLQDAAGKAVTVSVILTGGLLSYLVADPFIATASVVAFLVSELADFAVYTPFRREGYIRAAVTSNIVGSVVDTYLFLWIAGFGVTGQVVTGQLVGKLWITWIAIALVIIWRWQRSPLREVAAERRSHSRRGWTDDHDDEHGVEHLLTLALDYAVRRNRTDYIKAASLLVAAVECSDREATADAVLRKPLNPGSA